MADAAGMKKDVWFFARFGAAWLIALTLWACDERGVTGGRKTGAVATEQVDQQKGKPSGSRTDEGQSLQAGEPQNGKEGEKTSGSADGSGQQTPDQGEVKSSQPKAGEEGRGQNDGGQAEGGAASDVVPGVEVNKGLPTIEAKIGGKTFKLEVASEPKTREVGMMGRLRVPENTGMVFVFPRRDYRVMGFWMYHCYTDLDILYLDDTGRILKMHTMRKPEGKRPEESDKQYQQRLPTYSSIYPCGLAIEIGPGVAGSMGLKEGDRVEMDIAWLKKQAK